MQPTLIQPSHGNRETFSVSRLFELTSMSLRNKNCKWNSVSFFYPPKPPFLWETMKAPLWILSPIKLHRSSHKDKLDLVKKYATNEFCKSQKQAYLLANLIQTGFQSRNIAETMSGGKKWVKTRRREEQGECRSRMKAFAGNMGSLGGICNVGRRCSGSIMWMQR